MQKIQTARLELNALTIESITSELGDRSALAEMLEATVPADWPPPLNDEDSMRWTLRYLETHGSNGWVGYYIVLRDSRDLVGLVGYKGAPDEDGTVEVGYSVVPAHQLNGYASEATQALIQRAFADDSVTRVVAETYPELVASRRVMEKNGLEFIGAGSEDGVIRYELTRANHLTRDK